MQYLDVRYVSLAREPLSLIARLVANETYGPQMYPSFKGHAIAQQIYFSF